MDIFISIFAVVAGGAMTGLVTVLSSRQQQKHQLDILQLERRNEFTVENTLLHYLKEPSYPERKFETLHSKMGGFKEDELRQLLVKVGAVRRYRDDKTEWWSLLSRRQEVRDMLNKKKQAKRDQRHNGASSKVALKDVAA